MFPTCTFRPPSTSGSTFEDSSTLRSVCSSMRLPMSFTSLSSSSTALVTVTGRSLFSSAQSASNSRLMRNSAGIRWRSASSSRKFTKRSSASLTTFRTPSRFSSDEKYGENRNTCSVRSSESASANSPSSSCTRSSTSCSFATSNSERAYTSAISSIALAPVSFRAGQLREVDLAEGLLDQAAVVLLGERLARDLLGGRDGQVRDLLAQLVERAASLVLDVATGLREQLLALLDGLRLGLVLEVLTRLARAGDDVLGLLARLAQAGAVLLEQLVGLLLGALRGLDRFLDRHAAPVERLGDPRERELVQEVERDAEREQRPDHQPEARADEEAAASALLGCCQQDPHRLEEERDQAEDERVEDDRLGEGEAEPLDARDLLAHLGLTGDRLDHLAEDVAHADARADRAEPGADAERDRLEAVGGVGCLCDGNQNCKIHGTSLVASGACLAEVNGCERREDEGLQRGDQADLEHEEGDGDRKRDPAERREPEQHREPAAHEQDEQVAGEDVREQSDRERDDPHELGDHLDEEDRARRDAGDAGRQPALEVPAQAVAAHALDLVAAPDHERQHERNGEVGRGRVQGEGRQAEAEDVDRLLRVRRQRDVAEHVREPDEEEERGHEGEVLRRRRDRHVALGDLGVGEVVGALDERLHPVRAVLHALGDVDHHGGGDHAGEDHVEHGLVERHVDRAELQVEPGVELELVLGLELVVLAVAPDDPVERDRAPEPDERAEQDHLLAAHRFGSSNGRVSIWLVK